nr:hypothetical protein [Bacteroidota bacterium]
MPDETPSYRTFSSSLRGIYSDERHLVKILTIFTTLAIFISVKVYAASRSNPLDSIKYE